MKKPSKVKPLVVEYDTNLVGYVRVSTEEQNPDMQIVALQRAGVHPDNIHVEKISGAALKRPARDMARRQLRSGMTLVIWKLDRIGRDHIDLYTFVQNLADNGIGVRSITEYVDTNTPIGKFVLILLSAAAQFEREIIQERTRSGVKRAMERGVRFGQPSIITADIRAKVDKWLHQGLSIADIVKRFKAEKVRLAESTIRKYWKAKQIARARKGQRNK